MNTSRGIFRETFLFPHKTASPGDVNKRQHTEFQDINAEEEEEKKKRSGSVYDFHSKTGRNGTEKRTREKKKIKRLR